MAELGELDKSTVKRDGNVPPKPGGFYALLVGANPSWIRHEMAAGKQLNGKFPAKPAATLVDPDSVKAGLAVYTLLEDGGLFVQHGQSPRGTVIHDINNDATATLTIVHISDPATTLRSLPASFPFDLGQGEMIKATGGQLEKFIAILANMRSQQQL